ncbi:transmembrane protein 164-like [Diadema antillarum]|uniref:transmembrane protein 164-like n=1 Tax=Diadema antillarum TaxID=105358 RepID=UPI003A8A5AEA
MNSTESVVMWSLTSLDWLYGGVDPTIAGNGGQDCVDFLTRRQRVVESSIFVLLCSLEVWLSWRWLKEVPDYTAESKSQAECFGKRFLLVVLCLTFGIEVGFKLANKTVIFLLNPCHMLTIVQIYLLAAPPSKLVTVIFRMQISALSCPLLAIVLPVLNTRVLPFEPELYWIQHLLIYIVIPPYLMSLGGVYKTEGMWDFSWCTFTLGFLFLYHVVVLQIIGVLTQTNLNNMVCPAVSDPFHGPFYRVCAFFHQHALFPLHVKVYTYIVKSLIHTDSESWNGEVVKKDK